MATADLQKHVERADKLIAKGKKDEALGELLIALQVFSDNEMLLDKASDLALSMDDQVRASELLHTAFRIQLEERNLAKAKVIYRKLGRLRALDPDLMIRFAELLQNTSRREAAEVYLAASTEYRHAGLPKESLLALCQAVDLNPRQDSLRLQAEMAMEMGEKPLAARALVQLADVQAKEGVENAESYARAYQCDPTNTAAALGYGRSLVEQGLSEQAVELLRPFATSPQATLVAREPYALALLKLGRVLDAEPYLWKLFESDPDRHFKTLVGAIDGLLGMGEETRAIGLARRLEEHQRRAGAGKEFPENLEPIAAANPGNTTFLEYLGEVYNGLNREVEYMEVLFRLFDVYLANNNSGKAFDALDRAVDVNCYERTLRTRMAQLRGLVDPTRLASVARRIGVDADFKDEPEKPKPVQEEPAASPALLQDLMVQAELLLQYLMRERAVDKIREIQQYFPDEVQTNPRLRDLMRAAGLGSELERAEQKEPETSEGFAKAAEIGRLIAQQSDPRTLLSMVANEIGRLWELSRCVGVLGMPGQPPTAVVEYCSANVLRSQRTAMARLVAAMQRFTAGQQILPINDVTTSEVVSELRSELEVLAVRSLIAIALVDGDRMGGLLILQQCNYKRSWTAEETAILRSLADQISLALQGIRLRSLVRTLGVSDERSGLLNRASYLDVLLAEIHRSRTSGSTVTVALMELRPSEQAGQVSEDQIAGVSSITRDVFSSMAVNFRYNGSTIAAVLPGVKASAVSPLIGKIRDAMQSSLEHGIAQLTLSSVIAEAMQEPNCEESDIVTELINRADRALVTARMAPGTVSIVLPEESSTPAE
ncbi:MAG TPA: GAF domain-containing protein [Terriglobales bacterium]